MTESQIRKSNEEKLKGKKVKIIVIAIVSLALGLIIKLLHFVPFVGWLLVAVTSQLLVYANMNYGCLIVDNSQADRNSKTKFREYFKSMKDIFSKKSIPFVMFSLLKSIPKLISHFILYVLIAGVAICGVSGIAKALAGIEFSSVDVVLALLPAALLYLISTLLDIFISLKYLFLFPSFINSDNIEGKSFKYLTETRKNSDPYFVKAIKLALPRVIIILALTLVSPLLTLIVNLLKENFTLFASTPFTIIFAFIKFGFSVFKLVYKEYAIIRILIDVNTLYRDSIGEEANYTVE